MRKMKAYIKPDLKYIALIQEPLMAGSEKIVDPYEYSEEGANRYSISEDVDVASQSRSVWE